MTAVERTATDAPYLDEIEEGVFAYVQPDGSWMINNAGIVNGIGSAGHLLIDTTSTEARNRALFAAAEKATGTKLRALVNTHHHPDHTYGNWLVPESVPIIGSTESRDEVIAAGFVAAHNTEGPDFGRLELRPPDQTFTGKMTLHLGARVVELIHVGPAHTVGDVIVWLPGERVCFAGDIAFVGSHPFLIEGSIPGYRQALQFIRGLGAEVMVPGHGPVRRGMEIDELLDQLEDYVTYVERVAAAGRRAGLTPLEAAIEAADSTPFEGWGERERLVANLIRAYEADSERPPGDIELGPIWPQMADLIGRPIVSKA